MAGLARIHVLARREESVAGKLFGSRRKGTARERDADQTGSPEPNTARAVPNPHSRVADLSRQAKGLFADRQFDAAIPVFQEAIDLLRRSPQIQLRPCQVMLGVDLSLQAVCLSTTGSTRQGLAAAEESAAILTAISGPDAFLLRSLETVALLLHALSERPEDKAAAAMRAAALMAQAGDPEPKILSRRHVMLNFAANVLVDSGQVQEALRLRKEAVDVAEAIVKGDPARRHRLATDYSSLAVLHAKGGDFVEASAAADACEASLSDPEYTASSADRFVIARNLSGFGRLLAENSRRGEALHPYGLAIDLFRGLPSDTPEPAAPTFARSLNNLAWNLCVLGEQDEALPFAEEAVDLLRAIAEPGPAHRELLSSCLDTLATALAMAGRGDEALAACREAIDIKRESAEADREKHQAALASFETLRARILGRESGSFIER